MKRNVIALLCAAALFGQSVSALAAETTQETTQSETTEESTLEEEEDSSLQTDSSILASVQALSQTADAGEDETTVLTLEDATKRVLQNSTELKKSASSVDLLEDAVDIAGISLTYSSEGSDISDVANLLSQQISLQNSKLSQATQEEVLAFSVEQTYSDLIVQEQEIALAEDALALEEKDLSVAAIQLEMGLLSQQEYDEMERSLQDSKSALQLKKDELEKSYIAFNLSMRIDTSTRYQLEMPVEYEATTLEIPLESYVNAKAEGLSSILQQKKSLQATRATTNATKATSTEVGSYTSVEVEYNNAEMDLEDSLDAAKTTIRNAYYQLLDQERSIESSIKNLEALEKTLANKELEYEMGTVSALEVAQAQQAVKEAQVSLLSALYSHQQLQQQFENPDLL